ncbi:MAG: hypothetical protein BWY57_03495 [Betaproteobacteria bacterium ADurb.Bin341]|nr:MAG: hypothetical protein BWY57_03495 [Betaproteobacteria bacterium ADurb.Bin341]
MRREQVHDDFQQRFHAQVFGGQVVVKDQQLMQVASQAHRVRFMAGFSVCRKDPAHAHRVFGHHRNKQVDHQFLRFGVDGAHHAEIEKADGRARQHQNIAGVNISVVNTVRENLFRQQRHQLLGERVAVIAQPDKLINPVDLDAFQLFQHQHLVGAEFFVNKGYLDRRVSVENFSEFKRVVHFTLEIHLHADRLIELFHDAVEVQVAQLFDMPFEQGDEAAQQVDVCVDQHLDARPLYFHDHRLAGGCQACRVHLGKRSRAQGLLGKINEKLAERSSVLGLYHFDRFGQRQGFNTVLQPSQLVGDAIRQQIPPRAEHLAELDERRPQTLARCTQSGTKANGGVN